MIHHMQHEHVLYPPGLAKNAEAFQEFVAAYLPELVLFVEFVDGQQFARERVVPFKVNVIQVNADHREVELRGTVKYFQRRYR